LLSISVARKPRNCDAGSQPSLGLFGELDAAQTRQRVTLPESALTIAVPCDGIVRQETSVAQITLIEPLAWLKTLKRRHEEVIELRNDNPHRERRFLGSAVDRELVKEPVYDIKTIVASGARSLVGTSPRSASGSLSRLESGRVRCSLWIVGFAKAASGDAIVISGVLFHSTGDRRPLQTGSERERPEGWR
jgi:hypothetical protein